MEEKGKEIKKVEFYDTVLVSFGLQGFTPKLLPALPYKVKSTI